MNSDNSNPAPGRAEVARRPADVELLSRTEAANFLGVSVSSLAHWAHSHLGLAYTRLGRSPRYRVSDLDAWIAGRLRIPAGG